MTPIVHKLRIPLLVCAAVALAFGTATALGGSGVGGVFNLGQGNTVDAQTSLTGSVGGNAQLRVENSSTGSNASALLGKITQASAAADSTAVRGVSAATDPGAAAVAGVNTGGGPAFAANVKPGAPPLSVNSTTKVANLNADQLDGKDSAAFDLSEVAVHTSPWALRSLSSGTTIAVAAGPKATVTASTIGAKTLVLPLDYPNLFYPIGGGVMKADYLQVCFSVSNASTAITSTALKEGITGQASTVFSDSTVLHSTSPGCYTVFASPPQNLLGSAYVQLSVTFGGIGQSITLYSSALGLRKI